MNKPILTERFLDNGEHSHWELTDSETGNIIWSENPIDKPEWLLCAAVKRVTERDCPKLYWEQFHDIYKIELGWRHPDIFHRFGNEVSHGPDAQGFYTSKARFVSREEGLEIALKAGQVQTIIGGMLTSEDLY